MPKRYKLTRNSVSLIRVSAEDVQEALANGFAFMGECDQEGEIINPDAQIPVLVKPEKKGKK